MVVLHQFAPKGKPVAQTFTSKKFDTLKCVCFDRRLSPVDVEVHSILLQFVNETTGRCFPSQELIAQRGRLSVRQVIRSFKRLVGARWWKCQRTGRKNIYTLLFVNVSAILDEITAADDERRERNRCHRCHIRPHGKVPPVSHQICHRCHPNTLEEHPQKRGLVEEEESADQKLKLRLMGVVEGGR